MLVFVCPLKVELKLLIEEFKKLSYQPETYKGLKFKAYTINNYIFTVGGVKQEIFDQSCTYLKEKLNPQQIICVGTAGALDPTLKVGDLITEQNLLAFSHKEITRYQQRQQLDPKAKAVVMEGYGFTQIRAISDYANQDTISEFNKGLAIAMSNIAKYISSKYLS